ncbi:MAG: hypothetical protein CBD58_03895 [bacterium TMED198]|nr:MAG: hypothetical protein CBD58_03895 [bacterium TMED198]
MIFSPKKIFLELFKTNLYIVVIVVVFFLWLFDVSLTSTIFLSTIFILLLVSTLSFFVSRSIAKPLEEMVESAKMFSKGDFLGRIKTSGAQEINSLAFSLNEMARQLNDRIKTITVQKNENDAILFGMSEGLVATNRSNEIIKINDRLRDFFDLSDNVLGHDIRTVIRNKSFLDFYEELVSLKLIKKIESRMEDLNKKTLLCSGVILTDQDGEFMGTVVIVNDITKITALEKVRKEFVANVSHELKTPLTALKGYFETLRDVDNKKDRIHFLNILERQIARMDSIVNDLLELSRLEEQEGKSGLSFSSVNILNLVDDAIKECKFLALKKEIKIELASNVEISFRLNKRLVQEALVNLIQNGIQYSNVNSKIIVSCSVESNQLILEVEDFGIGMKKTEIENIFKRFYCIDKSHSKEIGGTGLGLSIVKHIVGLHRGEIKVETQLGRGSKFTILIPEKQRFVRSVIRND